MQDRNAFKKHADYEARREAGVAIKATRGWHLLHLSTAMAIFMRATLWMSEDHSARLADLLDGAGYTSWDDKARAAICVAQMYAQRGTLDAGFEWCAKGLEMEPRLGEETHEFGTIPMLHYLTAHIHAAKGELRAAEVSLQASVAATSREMKLHHFLSFKCGRLRRMLGLQFEQAYTRLDIPAGKKATIAILLARPQGGPPFSPHVVEWDWGLEAYDLDFGVRFVPTGGGAPLEAVPTTRHDGATGPVVGRFELPPGCERGVLELCFSNYYSYLRSKAVTYRLVLPPHTTEPKPLLV